MRSMPHWLMTRAAYRRFVRKLAAEVIRDIESGVVVTSDNLEADLSIVSFRATSSYLKSLNVLVHTGNDMGLLRSETDSPGYTVYDAITNLAAAALARDIRDELAITYPSALTLPGSTNE